MNRILEIVIGTLIAAFVLLAAFVFAGKELAIEVGSDNKIHSAWYQIDPPPGQDGPCYVTMVIVKGNAASVGHPIYDCP